MIVLVPPMWRSVRRIPWKPLGLDPCQPRLLCKSTPGVARGGFPEPQRRAPQPHQARAFLGFVWLHPNRFLFCRNNRFLLLLCFSFFSHMFWAHIRYIATVVYIFKQLPMNFFVPPVWRGVREGFRNPEVEPSNPLHQLDCY